MSFHSLYCEPPLVLNEPYNSNKFVMTTDTDHSVYFCHPHILQLSTMRTTFVLCCSCWLNGWWTNYSSGADGNCLFVVLGSSSVQIHFGLSLSLPAMELNNNFNLANKWNMFRNTPLLLLLGTKPRIRRTCTMPSTHPLDVPGGATRSRAF